MEVDFLLSAVSRSEEAAGLDAELEAVRGDFGTQLTFVLRRLLEIRAKNKGTKSIIFSQWARVLKLVTNALDDDEFSYAY